MGIDSGVEGLMVLLGLNMEFMLGLKYSLVLELLLI